MDISKGNFELSHNFVKFQNLYLKYSVGNYEDKFSEIDKLKALIHLFFHNQLPSGLSPESCFQGFWGSKLLNGC